MGGRRKPVPEHRSRCYRVTLLTGEVLEVMAEKPPSEKTIAALKEVYRLVLAKMDAEGVDPERKVDYQPL